MQGPAPQQVCGDRLGQPMTQATCPGNDLISATIQAGGPVFQAGQDLVGGLGLLAWPEEELKSVIFSCLARPACHTGRLAIPVPPGPCGGWYQVEVQPGSWHRTVKWPNPRSRFAIALGQSHGCHETSTRPGLHGCPASHRSGYGHQDGRCTWPTYMIRTHKRNSGNARCDLSILRPRTGDWAHRGPRERCPSDGGQLSYFSRFVTGPKVEIGTRGARQPIPRAVTRNVAGLTTMDK